jgi:hypothetical protein
MKFKLKIRNITKEDEKNLYKKYRRIFKKNWEQKDLADAICPLFLDLIYIYFDNKKRKLYKLFFPVIMANFMELGSINSVILTLLLWQHIPPNPATKFSSPFTEKS